MLMLALYNIVILLYLLAVHLVSFFNPKAKKWITGRNNLLENIKKNTRNFDGKTVWFHCASLGEFEMARPILEGVKTANSNTRIVLTFFSPSGYEIRKNYEGADYVFHLPIDTKTNAKKFIAYIKPTTVIIVKYDLWFHHLNEAKNAGAELLLISAQFRQKQYYFRLYGTIGRRTLQLFDHLFLIDKNSKKLLETINIKTGITCGDTRYDRAMEAAENAKTLTKIAAFKSKYKLIVCGSTWREDEIILVETIKKFPEVKWIIAPHEVAESNLNRLEKLLLNTVRFSNLDTTSKANILIIDNIGFLNTIYRYADVAYIGGGFKTGLHNILEATAYGIPTVFGPDNSRFPDAAEMNKQGLAFSINNEKELAETISILLNENQTELRKKIINFMQSKTGATQVILNHLKSNNTK